MHGGNIIHVHSQKKHRSYVFINHLQTIQVSHPNLHGKGLSFTSTSITNEVNHPSITSDDINQSLDGHWRSAFPLHASRMLIHLRQVLEVGRRAAMTSSSCFLKQHLPLLVLTTVIHLQIQIFPLDWEW
ncbi:hypothetical protein NPIL_441671 [Nephila pilipes]|uniref:Uncharacterized protein n=1 Tax=Nephila pilipes TaxID=299642 RepID=A0A8X6T891_NEPPI|nr:hypothetical protein NPIL_441671 [Nephila pilipes]